MFRKKRAHRWVICLFADIHCGSRLAICPPGVILQSNGMDGSIEPWTPSLTPAQAELWDLYHGNIDQVMDYADGDPVCVILVGDPTQGGHFKDQLMVSDVPNQVTIAEGVIDEWLKLPTVTHFRLATGTDVHEFEESAATRILANYLTRKYPDKNIAWSHHELLDVDGKTIDYAHHGPGAGKRKWLEMNNASWYLRDVINREIWKGRTPPDLVVRADKHSCGMCSYSFLVGDRFVTSQLVVIPSYQTLTAYARKVTQSAYEIYHGMVAVEVVNGVMSLPRPFIKLYDLRHKSVLR